MRSKKMMETGSRRLGIGASLATLVGVVALTGCGSDDASAQEQYCAAGESLESSLDALTNLDLIAEGTDGLDAAIEDVRTDLGDLADSASEAAADEVGALEQSVGEVEEAISALGGELSTDNAAAVGTAIQAVGSSAQAVLQTLTDC